LVAFVPDQAPEALQLVALVDDQFRVALPPRAMALGPTLRFTLGAADFTVTVADWVALPPVPLQVRI
jgi:hypothetical protein